VLKSRFLANIYSGLSGGRSRCVLLLTLLPLAAVGQSAPADEKQDTRHKTQETTLRLPEARIRAVGPERFAVGSRRLALDSLTLAQYRGASLAEALQARSPLYIKSYGPGQLASISLRGTSARHTAVLWQGFNINIPSLGEADFALLPLGATTRVAVQPGPAAALYGSGTVGGAVLLDTDPDWRPGTRGSVQADAGSFGTRGGSAEASGVSGASEVSGVTPRLAWRTAFSGRAAQNDYPYWLPTPAGPERRRLVGAALLHQLSLSQDLRLRLGTAGELSAAAWLTDTDREIQPSIYAAPSQAGERDQSRRLLLGYRHLASARRQWAVRAAWVEDRLDYREGASVDRSLMRTTQAQAEHTLALGSQGSPANPWGSLRVGAEMQHFAAAVDGYDAAEIRENRAAAFALLRLDPRPGLRLSGNLRQALLPGGAAPLSPTLGIEWDLISDFKASEVDNYATKSLSRSVTQSLTATASAARSYRAPTLNERYWRPGGNPDLRPETGWGYEAGLRHRAALALDLNASLSLTSELTGFHQLINDWVQWLPGSTAVWSPRNLRQVRTQGLEASTTLAWRRGRYALNTRAAYHLTETTKLAGAPADADPVGRQLPFVPRHQAAFVLDQQWRGWGLSAQAGAVSARYTDPSATVALPAYTQTGTALSYTWRRPGFDVTSSLRGTNLFGQAYQSYPGRPAPPRAWQASLRLDWR